MTVPYTRSMATDLVRNMAVSQTEKKRQKRQKRKDGFDCEFTERPQEQFQAICPICLLVLREPHQVSCCGYNFCRLCVEPVQLEKSPCPMCNLTEFTVFLNKGLRRSLYAFKVRCAHEKEGCQWTGELGELDKHLNDTPHLHGPFSGCEYVKIECCYCNGQFKRSDITTHQIETCTKRPYMLSLLTRYIDHRLQKSERKAQEREKRIRESGQILRKEFEKDKAQLFSMKDELKHEVQTVEQYCRDEVQTLEQSCLECQAKLADQQKSTKLVWWVLVAMTVMFVALTGLTWNYGSQTEREIVHVRHGNDQLEDKEIVIREEFEMMTQQFNQKLESEKAGAARNRQGIHQLKDMHSELVKEYEKMKQLLNQNPFKGSVQEESEGFLYYAIFRPLMWLVGNVLLWLFCCAIVAALGKLNEAFRKRNQK